MPEYPPLLALVLALVLGTAAVECTPRVPPVSPLHNASDDLLRNATRDDRVVDLGRRRLGDGDDGARTYAWNRCFGPATAYAGAWFARLPTARTTRFGDSLGMEYHDYNLFHEVQSHFCVCVCAILFVCGRNQHLVEPIVSLALNQLLPLRPAWVSPTVRSFSLFLCAVLYVCGRNQHLVEPIVSHALIQLSPLRPASVSPTARGRARARVEALFVASTLKLSLFLRRVHEGGHGRPRIAMKPLAPFEVAVRNVVCETCDC